MAEIDKEPNIFDQFDQLEDEAPPQGGLPSLLDATRAPEKEPNVFDQFEDAPQKSPLVDQLDREGLFDLVGEAERGKQEKNTFDAVWNSFGEAVSGTVRSFGDATGIKPGSKIYDYGVEPLARVLDLRSNPIAQSYFEVPKAEVRGLANTIGSMASGVDQIATSLGADSVKGGAGSTAKALRDFATSDVIKARVETLDKIKGETWFKDTIDYWLSKGGEGLGSSAPFLGAGYVGGLPAVLGVGYLSSLGELREELKESGVHDEKTLAQYSYLAAIPHSLLDTMTERGFFKKTPLNAEAKKIILQGLVRTMLKYGAKEGLTEGAQRIIEIGAVAHANGGEAPNAAVLSALFDDANKGIRSTILESAVSGFIPGKLFGAGAYVDAQSKASDAVEKGKGLGLSPSQRIPQDAVIDLDPLAAEPAKGVQEAKVRTRTQTDASPAPPAPVVQQGEELPPIAASEVPFERTPLNLDERPESGQETGEISRQAVDDTAEQPAEIAAEDADIDALVDADLPALNADIEEYLAGSGVERVLEKPEVREIARNIVRGEPVESAVEAFLSKADPEVQAVVEAIASDPEVTETLSTPEGQRQVEDVVTKIAKAIEPSAVQADPYERFREVLSGTTPSKRWARQLGITPEEMKPLVRRAKREGLIRVGRGGTIRRTAKAKEQATASRITSRNASAGTENIGQSGAQTSRNGAPRVTQQARAPLSRYAQMFLDEQLDAIGYAEGTDLKDVPRGDLERLANGLDRALEQQRTSDGRYVPGVDELNDQDQDIVAARAAVADEISRDTEFASRQGEINFTLSIPSDVRFDGAVTAREAQTGRPVKTIVLDYATELEQARIDGTSPDPILDRIAADRDMKKIDMHDLAHVAGYPVRVTVSKADALATVRKRHFDFQGRQNPTLEVIADKEAEYAERQALREAERDVPEARVSEGIRDDEAGRDARGAPGANRDGSRGPGQRTLQPDEGQSPRGDGATAGALRGDAAGDQRDGAGRADPGPAPELTDEQKAAVAAKIAADKEAADKKRADRERNNYRITDADRIGQGGPKVKIRANIDAIRILRKLDDEQRPATIEEKQSLVKYTGWGAFSQKMFSEYDPEFKKEREAFRSLVSKEEYQSAADSTINAHYTSPDVVKAMWEAMEYLGFKGGRAIEPGAGSGNFIGMMPDNLRADTEWTAVELDRITGGIAKAVYEAADVRVQGYETVQWPDNHFDLAISNVPFSDVRPYDPVYKGKYTLHDFYFLKSLDKVRPGGIVAFITSKGTLDKKNSAARREMAKRGTFLGAVRLPGGSKGAFKSNAGTDVTTDIIFLRKKIDGEPVGDQSWIETGDIETPDGLAQINQYFIDNPDMMLGKIRLTGTMYGKNEPVLIGSTDNIGDKIIAAVKAGLPEGAMTERGTAQQLRPVDTETDGIKDGSYYIKGKELYRKVAGIGEPQTFSKSQRAIVENFMGLRDIVNEMLAIQGGTLPVMPADPAKRLSALRKALNKNYAAFVKAHGPINKTLISKQTRKDGKEITIKRMPNLKAFENDPDAFKVAAIEVYDEKTGEAKRAAIFTQDVVAAYIPPDIREPADALAVSLNEKGRVDLDLIASRLNMTVPEVETVLDGLIFRDPDGEVWRTRDDYLSGDVVGKLEAAELAAKSDPRYAANVEALTAVQPEPLTKADIRVQFGAPYVPSEVYEEYISSLMSATRLKIVYNETLAQWKVEGNFGSDAQTQYGTKHRDVDEIIEHALNNIPVTITTKDEDGNTIRLPEAEAEARAKIDLIKDTFSGDPDQGIDGWIWQDYQRAERIAALYNRQFNRISKKSFDGSHLTFPGLARVVTAADGSTFTIDLKPHRVNAIWQIIQNGNTLLNHAVGSGKAQPLDANVLTPDGWMRMGDIQVGDQVISADGQPTTVLGVYPQGEKEIFKVVFSDGSSTECCDEHLWFTQTYRERSAWQRAIKLGKDWASGKGKVRSLAEIRSTLVSPHLNAKNHSIPMVSPVALNARPVPLDPYLVGVLIGDGSLRGREIAFASADAEIIESVKKVLPPQCEVRYRSGYDYAICYTGEIAYAKRAGIGNGFRGVAYEAVRSHPVAVALDELGMRGKYAHEKRVPKAYLNNSIEVRTEVLRGLMDTDGTVDGKGYGVSFCTSSPGLAEDVTYLVRSLGGIVGRSTKRIAGYRDATILSIALPPQINPFRLKRKAERVRPKSKYVPARYIVDIVPVGTKPAQCIAVSSPSHLYVTDDFVVTHNTWTSIMASMEMKRLGMIQRPMFVVPNHMLNQFATEFYQAYPNAKLLIATKDQMSEKNRKKFAARIASDTWDGIIITHSSFTRLGMSKKAYEDFYKAELEEIDAAILALGADPEAKSSDDPTVKDLVKRRKRLKERLKKMADEDSKDEGVTFEETGVDFMFVDEAHLFKNLPFQTTLTRIKGIGNTTSKRAVDLYIKMRHMEKSRPGRSAVFMTGTPVSNTMAELYTMQRYLQGDVLRKYGVEKFDAWAATFGKIVTKSELSSDSRTYKDTTSFSQFVNIPELMAIAGEMMDTQTAEMLKLPRPDLKDGKIEAVEAQLSDIEAKALDDLISRMENRKNDQPFLPLFTEGIQLATDMRLVDPTAPFNPNGKIARIVDNVFSIWEEGNADPAAPNKGQLIFLDQGVPSAATKAKAKAVASGPEAPRTSEEILDEIRRDLMDQEAAEDGEEVEVDEDQVEAEALLRGKFNLYQDIKDRLIEKGIPANQIAFIHDAKTDDQKAKLFEKMRSGDIRVMIGSTGKMGVGTNVQKLLVAMHHADAPWRPADLEQRDGRILRQGNKNKEIRILRYITVKSFDAYRWQLLDRKSQFIGQLYAGAAGVRHMDDITPPLPEAAELKAAATGNPLIIERAELEREVKKLEVAERTHYKSQKQASDLVERFEKELASRRQYVGKFTDDAAKVQDMRGDLFEMTLNPGNKPVVVTDRKKAGEALKKWILSLGDSAWYSKRSEIFGEISGFAMGGTVRRTQHGIEVSQTLEGAVTYGEGYSTFVNENTDPSDLAMQWVRVLRSIPNQAAATEKEIARLEGEIPGLRAAAEAKPFPRTEALVAKRNRLREVIAELEEKPSASADIARIEEFSVPLEKIVNPIDASADDETKLAQIKALTAENKPILDAQLAAMDAKHGTTSNSNVKADATILSKASRPSILAKKPWHGIEHIRDTLRFQTRIKTFDQIEKAVSEILASGYSVVKIDTDKLVEPKEWGWRFVGFDLRAPNGQIIEWYIIFDTMYQAKKVGHLIFEKWRNLTADEIAARKDEYAADVRRSYELYNEAFEEGLRKSGYAGLEDARADVTKLSASLPEIAAKFSARSSGIGKSDADQGASGPALNQDPSLDVTQARPDSRSSRTSVIGGSPNNQNIGESGGNRKPEDAPDTGYESPPIMRISGYPAPRLKPEAESALGDGWVWPLVQELRRMLPEEVSISLTDRIILNIGNGQRASLNGYYDHSRRLIKIALEKGSVMSRQTGKHEVIHALRNIALFTDKEWGLLVSHAQKVGMAKQITMRDQNGRRVSALPEYRRQYAKRAASLGLKGADAKSYVDEMINQELVAKMAETWETGAKYPSKIEELLARIRQFLEAVRNVMAGYGFTTVDQVFEGIHSGAVANRAGSVTRSVTLPGGVVVDGVPLFSIDAKHVSKHDFDRFDSRKIGGGEGGQWFGYGHYFTASDKVVEVYFDAFRSNEIRINGVLVPSFETGLMQRPGSSDRFVTESLDTLLDRGAMRERLVNNLSQDAYVADWIYEMLGELERGTPPRDLAKSIKDRFDDDESFDWREPRIDEAADIITKAIAEGSLAITKRNPNVYAVRLDVDDDRLVALDVPLTEQSPFVAKALRKVMTRKDITGQKFIERLLGRQPAKRPDGYDMIVRAIKNKANSALSDALREAGVHGFRYLNGKTRGRFGEADPQSYNYVIFDDARIQILAKNGVPVQEPVPIASLGAMLEAEQPTQGAEQRRVFDSLGFYSKALKEARNLKQAKGTPEQMLAQLRNAGVKQAEIDATGLNSFFQGKPSVTRDEIVRHLEENGVKVKEQQYVVGGASIVPHPTQPRKFAVRLHNGDYMSFKGEPNAYGADTAALELEIQNKGKWASYSLDPSNPTYRETVLHLPSQRTQSFEDFAAEWRQRNPRAEMSDERLRHFYGQGRVNGAPEARAAEDFHSGHWSEPNVIAHARTSMVRTADGRPVFHIDELQSDWGQKLRDGGVRDEAKIARLETELLQAHEALESKNMELHEFRVQNRAELDAALEEAAGYNQRSYGPRDDLEIMASYAPPQIGERAKKLAEDQKTIADKVRLLEAEVHTEKAATPGHPLVNTTDQWVNTALRRAVRQAVEADAEYIAIPSGDTVSALNMGGEKKGIDYAYDEMYPKNLRNILAKIDTEAAKSIKAAKLLSPDGSAIERSRGHTLFLLTDKVKETVMNDGLPLFSLGSMLPSSAPRVGQFRSIGMGSNPSYPGGGTEAPGSSLSGLVEDLVRSLGLTVRHGRLNPGLKMAASRRGNALAGQYDARTGIIRVALPNDLATVAHEGGHALENRAETRAAVAAIKQQYVEDLTVAPEPDRPVPVFPTDGSFTGIEIDAETQAILAQAAEADTALRQMATQAGTVKGTPRGQARPAFDQAAYDQIKELAGSTRETLVRRIGLKRAESAILDLQAARPADPAAYLARRFSASGTPQPRQQIKATPQMISEGWAEFFRLYVTNPDQSRADAPRLFEALEDMIDAYDPAILEKIHAIQEGVDQLVKASPAGAVMSRVQSTVAPGMLARLRKEYEEKGSVRDMLSDRLYGFYHAFVDARHPWKRAVKHLLDTAERNLSPNLGPNRTITLKAIDDPYKRMRLIEHAKVHATATLQEGVRFAGQTDATGPSYHDALVQAFGGRDRAQWTDENLNAFGSYLVARRMLAEFDRHARGELEQIPDRVIGYSIWVKSKADLEKAYPNFEAAAKTLYAFNQNLLKRKYEAGFLTDDMYQELSQRVDYAPLNRIMDDGSPSSLASGRGNNKRRLFYRFQGSTRDFINPLESIAQDVYATESRIALNDTIKALDRLARAVGPGGGVIAERIPAREMKGTNIDIREALKSAARAQNLSESDRDGLMEIIDDLFDQDAAATIFKATDTTERGEPIVYLWEGGKRVPIRLGDDRIGRDIFEGLTLLGQGNSNIFIDVLSKGTQALRAGITKAPAYIITNFLRDQLAMWVLSENFTPFVTGASGAKSLAAGDEWTKRYSRFAGLMGGVDANLIDTAAGDRDVLTLRRKGFLSVPAKSFVGEKWFQFLRGMEASEAASRIGHFKAAYERARKDGLTEEEAAFEAAYAAHDVMDFSRRGASMMQAARIVAFLNAAVQGLDASRRTLFTSERNTMTGYREMATPFIKAATGSPLSVAEKKALPNSTRAWVKMAVIGMAGVALAALYQDDDEYEEFNDYMRATHWFFKINGTWYRYPKPFDLAVLSNAFEAAFERVWKGNERALDQFKASLAHTMVPPHEVNVANLYYEWQSGKDTFRDRDIIPMELSKLPPEMQFNSYTSEFGKFLGKTLGISPLQVDHVMGGLFGTLGRDALTLSDAVLPRLNKVVGGSIPGVSDQPRAEKSFEDYMVISRLSRRAGRGALSVEEFWRQMSTSGGEFVAAAEGYKALKRAGQPRDARDLIDNLSDEEKAFAYLEGEFREKEQDLHPLNRARQVMSAASGIRKELAMGRLFKMGTEPDSRHKNREPEEIVLAPSIQKIVNEVMEDITMREARNALVVIGHRGWSQKDIMLTDGLLAELRSAAPEVYEEFIARQSKGRNKVYSFEAVKQLWPQAKERILKEGVDANLSDLIGEAAGLSAEERARILN